MRPRRGAVAVNFAFVTTGTIGAAWAWLLCRPGMQNTLQRLSVVHRYRGVKRNVKAPPETIGGDA